jgi:hypothetical protein
MNKAPFFIGCYWIDGLLLVRVDDGRGTVHAEFEIPPEVYLGGANSVSNFFKSIDIVGGGRTEPAPRKDGLFLFMSARPA